MANKDYGELKNKELVLNNNYKMYRDKWGNTNDDRRLFCNTFDMIMESICYMQSMAQRGLINNYVMASFNKAIRNDRIILDQIIERFYIIEL